MKTFIFFPYDVFKSIVNLSVGLIFRQLSKEKAVAQLLPQQSCQTSYNCMFAAIAHAELRFSQPPECLHQYEPSSLPVFAVALSLDHTIEAVAGL